MNYTPSNSKIIVKHEHVVETDQAGKDGVFLIKPRTVFQLIESRFSDPVEYSTYIPSSLIGSITLLEGAVMASLIALIQPSKIFEFGTFMGFSTSLMLRNSARTCSVHSLDLPEDEDGFREFADMSEEEFLSNDVSNDNYLKFLQASHGERYLKSLPEEDRSRLHLLKGDSLEFDPTAHGLDHAVDFIFIDGGHESHIIDSDTKNALKMISNRGVIAWHDFNSNIHSDVTDYLTSKSGLGPVFHVENTLLALKFVNVFS